MASNSLPSFSSAGQSGTTGRAKRRPPAGSRLPNRLTCWLSRSLAALWAWRRMGSMAAKVWGRVGVGETDAPAATRVSRLGFVGSSGAGGGREQVLELALVEQLGVEAGREIE